MSEAKVAYNQGLYGVARLAFLDGLSKGDDVSECYYYLTRIGDAIGNELEIYQWGMMFLDQNPLDPRTKEVTNLVLNSILRQRWSFGAKNFLKRFGRLIDWNRFMDVIDSLVVWHDPASAADLLIDSGSKEGRSRAISILDSLKAYQTIVDLAVVSPYDYLLRARARLELGDTLSALYDFLTVDPREVEKREPYVRLALDFGFSEIGKAVLKKDADPLIWARLYLLLDDRKKVQSYLSRLSPSTLKENVDLCLKAEYSVPPALLIGEANTVINQFYELAIRKGRLDDAYLLANLMGSEEKMSQVGALLSGQEPVPESDSLSVLAREFEKEGKYDSAYSLYYQLKDYEGLARSLFHLGDYDNAYKLTKDDSLRFLILKATGKKSFWIIKRNLDKSWGQYEYSRVLLDNGKSQRALSYLLRCRDPRRLPLIVSGLSLENKDSLAVRLIKSYQLSDTKSLAILYDLNRFDDILSLTKATTDSGGRLYRMKALVREGQIRNAKRMMSGLDRSSYYESVCEYLVDRKRFGRVDTLIDRLEERTPKMRFIKALIPFYRGDYDSAVTTLSGYLKTEGQFRSRVLFKLGTCFYQTGDFERAAAYFRSLLRDPGLQHDALHNLLICLKKIGDWEAIIKLQNHVKDKPQYLFDIGYACLRKGLNKKALEIFEHVRKDRYSAEVQYWLAEARSGSGDVRGALLEYYRLYMDFPDNPEWRITAYFKMGLILEIIGDKIGAKKIYKNIMKRGKGDVWYEEAKSRLDNLD